MPPEEYEFVPGSQEQVDIFMDLQRMLVKMLNKWPGDTAVAVFGAAMGSATAMIESQYKQHLDECPRCKENVDETMLSLAETAKNNFEYYYNKINTEHEIGKEFARELVDAFFKGVKH